MFTRKGSNALAFCILLYITTAALGQGTQEYEETLPGCKEIEATECQGAAVAGGFGAISGALSGVSDRLSIADVWKENNFKRGKYIEQCLGINSAMASSPDIDKYAKGVITSIKSLDLAAAKYQDPNTLYNTLSGYIDTLRDYKSGSYRGIKGKITDRVLELVFPSCTAKTEKQEKAIEKAIAYAKKWNVDVIIKKIVAVNVAK